MPGVYQAVVQFPHVSGLPKDVQSLSFAVISSLSDTLTADRVKLGVEAYLGNNGPGGLDMSAYTSPCLSRAANAVIIDLYDVDGALGGGPHGSEVAKRFTTLGPGDGSAGLPSEVCSKVTLRAFDWQDQPVERPDGADPGSEVDRPRQRYTGGFYTCSLSDAAKDSPLQQTPRPKADFRTTLLQAVDQLWIAMNPVPLTTEVQLAVWSRADAAARVCDVAQVDNAFDIQRRKGEAATVRESVSLG